MPSRAEAFVVVDRRALNIAAALVGCGMMVCGSARAQTARAQTELGRADRVLLEQQVCSGENGVALAYARRIDGTADRPAGYTEVMCQPHAAQQGLPQVHFAQCQSAGGAWRCDAGGEALALVKGDAYVFIDLSAAIAPVKAVEIVRYVAKLGWFQGYLLSDLVAGHCVVAVGPTREWLLKCGYATIYVAEDEDAKPAERFRVFDVNVTVS